MEELTREAKIIIYTYGTLEELMEMELVEGPTVLTDSGRELFKKLKSDGFEPLPDEIKQCLNFIMEVENK